MSELMDAVAKRDLAAVKKLVAAGADSSARLRVYPWKDSKKIGARRRFISPP